MDIEKIRFLILAIQRQGERALAGYFKDIGVTPSQAEVLRVIQEENSLSLKELGERLICEHGSPSRLLATLVNKGYVHGQEGDSDRRIKQLTLTPQGKAVAEQIKQKEALFYQKYSTKVPADISQNLIEPLTMFISDPSAMRALELRGFIKNPA